MDCVLIGGAEGDRFAVFRDLIESTFSLKAIQATIRVWDNKTRQTRQVTIVQDL